MEADGRKRSKDKTKKQEEMKEQSKDSDKKCFEISFICNSAQL